MPALRALVVDDSRIFRTVLERVLHEVGDCEIVGSEFNGVRALEFLAKHQVDVVTLDVEMPGMNGLEVLRGIRAAQWPHPKPAVVMVSAHTSAGADITVKALELGAVGFVAKPSASNAADSALELAESLVDPLSVVQGLKSRSARLLRTQQSSDSMQVSTFASGATRSVRPSSTATGAGADLPTDGLLVIGSSTGGPAALTRLLPCLTASIDTPIAIVQHMPPLFTASLASSLDAKCPRYQVREASHGMKLQPRQIVIAPGNKQLRIKQAGGLTCEVSDDAPVQGCRPSVDVLFASTVDLRCKPITAVVLTGMGGDGSGPLGQLKQRGIKVIVQDEESSIVWGMPGRAVATGHVDTVAPLNEIHNAIIKSLKGAKCLPLS